MQQRHYTIVDRGCAVVDNFMRTVFGIPQASGRDDPADSYQQQPLNRYQRRQSAALMRVNHCGEVCAQALYQGQLLTVRQRRTQRQLEQAAIEENDHLLWCENRLTALGSHKSYLNAFFYICSFATGAIAGLLGDKWSLGFLHETEKQVEEHLTDYLNRLPQDDQKSRAVMLQMRQDEKQHASLAQQSGGENLPVVIKQAMVRLEKVMTMTTYYL